MREFIKKLEESARGTFWEQLGCRLVSIDERAAVVTLDVQSHHLNSIGILHGGVHASLLDNAMGILAMAARGSANVVTANLNIHYVSPLGQGIVTVTSEIVHQSGKIVTARGSIADAGGSLGAFGSGSFRVI